MSSTSCQSGLVPEPVSKSPSVPLAVGNLYTVATEPKAVEVGAIS